MSTTTQGLEKSQMYKNTWPKLCSCGTKYSIDEWETLYYKGVQKSGINDIPDFELRTCAKCLSTIAIACPIDIYKKKESK